MTTLTFLNADDENGLKKRLWQLPLFVGPAHMRSERLTAAGLGIVVNQLPVDVLNREEFFVSAVNALWRTSVPIQDGDRLAMIVLLEDTIASHYRLEGSVPDEFFDFFQIVIGRYDEARQSSALVSPTDDQTAADSLPPSAGTNVPQGREGVGARIEALGEEKYLILGKTGAADSIFLVDRYSERTTFRDMIQGRIDEHVMLIRAKEGMGKKTLLDAIWDASAALPRARVYMLYGGYTVGSLLDKMVQQLGSAYFSEFSESYQVFVQGFSTNSTDSTFRDGDAQFRIATRDGRNDPEARNDRNRILTSLFFKGIKRLQDRINQPVVLLIYFFQDASPEIQEWLANVFLEEHVSVRRWLVVVVAGEKIPEPRLEMRGWGVIRDLHGLGLQEWLEYFTLRKVRLSDDYYRFLHEVSDGLPYALNMFSENLLKQDVRSE